MISRLKTYLVSLLILLLAFCKKEYSKEGSDNAWRFKTESEQFGGPVDSAFLKQRDDGQSLILFGTAADNNNNKLKISINAESIHTGTYQGDAIEFFYSTISSGAINDGEISIIIQHIDDDNVTGIFSGTIIDALNQVHTISEGEFHCSLKRITEQTPKGILTVWTKEMCSVSNSIEVRIDDNSEFITSTNATQPDCNAAGTASFSLPTGNYSVQVICGSDTLNYETSVISECSFLEVNLNDDYLPLTKNSYWQYADVNTQNEMQTFTADGDSTADGKLYTRFVSTRDIVYYFRKADHVYYQYRPLGFQDFVSDPPFVELVILKDNLAAGEKWETPPIDVSISGVVQKIKLVSKIVRRDYSDVINGVAYYNLINVNTELFFSPDNGNSYAISGSAFNTVFARGVGIVKYNDMDINIEWGLEDAFIMQ